LVYHWFGWVAPRLHTSISIPATDWYLQHLELVTVIPALFVGYLNVARLLPAAVRMPIAERSDSMGMWAWAFPALVLAYQMVRYHPPSASVLYGAGLPKVRYFFEIQKVMPNLRNFRDLFANDPLQTLRVLTQMVVTAPFYAGVAYSLGAVVRKYALLTRLFTFEKHEESTTPSRS